MTPVQQIGVAGIIHGILEIVSIGVLATATRIMEAEASLLFILYALIAFGLRMPIGYFVGRLGNPREAGSIGCLLVAGGTLLFFWNPIVSLAVVGVGNALFHVVGGGASMELPRQSLGPAIFIAPGALGLALGLYLGLHDMFPLIVSAGIMLISGVVYQFFGPEKINSKMEPARSRIISPHYILLIVLVIGISAHAFAGFAFSFPWKTNVVLLALLTIAVVLGRGFGGYISDRFGWVKIVIPSLLVSLPLFAFGNESPWFGIIGMFFFNIAVPVSVALLRDFFPKNFAFAFGVGSLGILIGVLPKYVGVSVPWWGLMVSTLVATGIFFFVMWKNNKVVS